MKRSAMTLKSYLKRRIKTTKSLPKKWQLANVKKEKERK